mmetsp:Transcript_15572/g.39560  ORF Transcript_15572/g.39560 Transcript_15572/m.39560 type:complete len:324 (+) Transcript_15572:109-1080(+)
MWQISNLFICAVTGAMVIFPAGRHAGSCRSAHGVLHDALAKLRRRVDELQPQAARTRQRRGLHRKHALEALQRGHHRQVGLLLRRLVLRLQYRAVADVAAHLHRIRDRFCQRLHIAESEVHALPRQWVHRMSRVAHQRESWPHVAAGVDHLQREGARRAADRLEDAGRLDEARVPAARDLRQHLPHAVQQAAPAGGGVPPSGPAGRQRRVDRLAKRLRGQPLQVRRHAGRGGPHDVAVPVPDGQQRERAGGEEALPGGGVGAVRAHGGHHAALPVPPARRAQARHAAGAGGRPVRAHHQPAAQRAAVLQLQARQAGVRVCRPG